MNILRNLTRRRGTMILGIVALSLILRADGCVTEERDLNGSVAIALEAAFTTQGFTENTSATGSISSDEIDEIFDALDGADVQAIRDAVADGNEVLIAGLEAIVLENRGHSTARTGEIEIDTADGAGLRTAATMTVPNNDTGLVASAANGRIDVEDNFTGLGALQVELQAFLEAYLNDNRTLARSILNGIAWRASWTATGTPPSAGSPDDFDWRAEIILLVPAQYAIEVPNL